MFQISDNLTFLNIDQAYLKKLHDACSEVYYKSSLYDNKPYMGILVYNDQKQYVIPLSSAKEKHKLWKNYANYCYLIHETAKRTAMSAKDIWVDIDGENVKHILSILDIKKMIPIVEGVYSRVNINISPSDSLDVKNYKHLLNKEYIFCLKIINDVLNRATKLYERQLQTNKISKFCCDFRALEAVAYSHQ